MALIRVNKQTDLNMLPMLLMGGNRGAGQTACTVTDGVVSNSGSSTYFSSAVSSSAITITFNVAGTYLITSTLEGVGARSVETKSAGETKTLSVGSGTDYGVVVVKVA